MEFITGLKQQEEAELEDLLKAEEGTTIILEGAVHSIRDMGEIAFVILRKREGLIQTVWEEGKTDMELSEIREGDYIHVTGQIKDEERAPHGKEVRLSTIRHLSHVSCPLPLPIDKWKLNTSLEAKLDRRSLSLRISENGQDSVFRKESFEASVIFSMSRDLPRSTHQRSVQRVLRVVQTCSGFLIFTDRRFCSRVLSYINR